MATVTCEFNKKKFAWGDACNTTWADAFQNSLEANFIVGCWLCSCICESWSMMFEMHTICQFVLFCRSIDTKKAYFPPPDVRERIEHVARDVFSNCLAPEWDLTSLDDRKNKFKVWSSCLFDCYVFVLILHFVGQ